VFDFFALNVVAVADGALGFWQAIEEVWPKTRGQRCWVHKTANVLNKLPKSQQSKVAIESKRTIEIDEFVPKNEIDELYLNSPYYLVPDGEVGQQAFAVIREAIRKEGMVALGRVVFT